MLEMTPEARLLEIVENEWVRFFVRDAETGTIYKQFQGSYIPLEINGMDSDLDVYSLVPATHQTQYGKSVRRFEAAYTGASIMLALL